MKHPKRITVLLSDAEAARFAAYCREHGHKKATLVARLIREFLDAKQYPQPEPVQNTPSGRQS